MQKCPRAALLCILYKGWRDQEGAYKPAETPPKYPYLGLVPKGMCLWTPLLVFCSAKPAIILILIVAAPQPPSPFPFLLAHNPQAGATVLLP